MNGSVTEESSSDEQITITVDGKESGEPLSKEADDEVLNEYIQNWKDQTSALVGPLHMKLIALN